MKPHQAATKTCERHGLILGLHINLVDIILKTPLHPYFHPEASEATKEETEKAARIKAPRFA